MFRVQKKPDSNLVWLVLGGMAVIMLLALCVNPSEEARRRESAAEWLDSAQYVASESGDPQALMVAKFLRDHAAIATPLASTADTTKVRILKVVPSRARVLFVPMIEGDQNLGPLWAQKYDGGERKVVGGYIYREGILFMRPVRLSRIFRGFIMIHEGLHVLQRPVNSDRSMHQDSGERELEAYNLEVRLFAHFGGVKYERELTKEVVNKLAQTAGRQVEPKEVEMARDAKTLERIFGSPTSPDEAALQRLLWRVAITFSWLEAKFSPEVAEVGKLAFVKLVLGARP